MLIRKQVLKMIPVVVMGLIPGLLYPNLAQATCDEEIPKLKAAADAYKATIGGRAILPDDIKSLLRERYNLKYLNQFDPESCLKTKIKNPTNDGWELKCSEYQVIRKKLHVWHKSHASGIENDAYEKYRAWSSRWGQMQVNCYWFKAFEMDKIEKLKQAGLVPNKRDK